MKKLLLTIGTTTATVAPIVTTIACGTTDTVSVVLKGVGSNSVTPVTNNVTANTIYTLDYSNTGSTNGVRGMSAETLEYDFGMMSSRKSPQIGDNSGDLAAQAIKNWEDNNIRTVTYAIDSIGIHVNLPKSIETFLDGDRPIVLIDELSKLYDTDPTNNAVTWDQLLDQDLAASNVSDADTIIATAVGVSGGAEVSGKSEAFVDKITDADENHEAIGNQFFGTPDEAIQLFDAVKNNENSVGYHSVGFLESHPFATIANIKWTDSDNIQEATTSDVQTGSYTWIRLFNVAFSIDNTAVIDFISFLLRVHYQDEISELGFVPLSDAQIKLQTVTHPFTGENAVADINGANAHADLDYGLVL